MTNKPQRSTTATKPAADKKAAPHAEPTAGAAALLCAMSGTANGPVDDAVVGGVASDDGAKVAGAGPSDGTGDRAVETGPACALDRGTGGGVADERAAGAGAGARWWRLVPVHVASAMDGVGAAARTAPTRAMRIQRLRPREAMGARTLHGDRQRNRSVIDAKRGVSVKIGFLMMDV